MELKNDEFQTLRLRVDQISSELDKQNTVRVVNTKWMIIVGAVILSALGFTSFVQLPREANRAVEEKVGKNIIDIANDLVRKSEEVKKADFVNLPIGTIIASMLEPSSFAKTVGDPDPSDFDPKISKWVLANGRKVPTDSKYYMFTPESRIPDLRGMFLRGINCGRNDGREDPNDRREPGSYQKDALQEHGHETTATGYQYDVPDEASHYKWGNADLGYTGTGLADIVPADVTSVKDPDKDDEETRPKNVAVYFYIKIN